MKNSQRCSFWYVWHAMPIRAMKFGKLHAFTFGAMKWKRNHNRNRWEISRSVWFFAFERTRVSYARSGVCTYIPLLAAAPVLSWYILVACRNRVLRFARPASYYFGILHTRSYYKPGANGVCSIDFTLCTSTPRRNRRNVPHSRECAGARAKRAKNPVSLCVVTRFIGGAFKS